MYFVIRVSFKEFWYSLVYKGQKVLCYRIASEQYNFPLARPFFQFTPENSTFIQKWKSQTSTFLKRLLYFSRQTEDAIERLTQLSIPFLDSTVRYQLNASLEIESNFERFSFEKIRYKNFPYSSRYLSNIFKSFG